MPVFEYRGVNKAGKSVKGVLDADSPKALKESLKGQGIYLSEYNETSAGARGSDSKTATSKGTTAPAAQSGGGVAFLRRGRRIKITEVAEVTRQLATLLKAAIPIVDCFDAVGKQSENPSLRRVLNEVRRSVSEGKGLAPAMAEYPGIFNDLYVNMVKAGESSGTLDLVFQRLADFTEQQARLRSKIVAALTYPIIMMFLGLVIVSVMMIFVVPKLTAMFTDMGQKLPMVTRILIGVADYFQNWWHVSIGAIVFAVFMFNRYRRSESGRKRIDRMVLKVPLFGGLIRLVAIARFARTLGTLLRSGVPIMTSLEIVKFVVGNTLLAETVEEAKLAVKEGQSLAKPLERSGQFPAMMVHMVAVGEQSGQLEEMLDNVASAYEMQVDSRVSVLTALLEPIMILFMGGAVAFIVMAIMTPMIQMNELLKV